jgi:hypothetical protein
MPAPKSPKHVVVDGSNIATEGRSAPSLKQLNEAVLAFLHEFPETKVTVVVDASFGKKLPSSTPPSTTTNSSPLRRVQSAGVTPSCLRSPTR